MFKSFSDSIRSLWQSKTPETVKTPDRKRKRPPSDTDLDDSDVEIVSVKKPKQESLSSSPGLFSFLAVPICKMSDWVRKKTVSQDHVFVHPVTKASTNFKGDGGQPNTRSSLETSATNGSYSCIQNTGTGRLLQLPMHSRNGAHENGVNGDVHVVDVQPCSFLSSSSRRSSSCSTRPGHGRRSTVEQCFQLKEKEDYLKLLQQYTTLDLGYDTESIRQKEDPVCGTATPTCLTRRRRGDLLPVPSSLSSLSTSTTSSLPSSRNLSARPENSQPVRFGVAPSHFTQNPLLPSDKVAAERTRRRSSSREMTNLPHPPGRAQQAADPVAETLVSSRLQCQKSHQDGDTEEQPIVVSSADSDSEVIIVEGHWQKVIWKSRLSHFLHFKSSQYLDEEWINRLNGKYASAEKERQRLIKDLEKKKRTLEETRENSRSNLNMKLRFRLNLEVGNWEIVPRKPMPVLTSEMLSKIDEALADGPENEILSEGFRLKLTRGDFATLRNHRWLNDSVINFYLSMLMSRGEQEGFSRTCTFNTFFYNKLLSGGHTAVKRWTRRLDIFSYRYLVIPIHLEIHWCLCVVSMKDFTIRYYDSMRGNNLECLMAIRLYLCDESLEKRNTRLSLSDWSIETVADIPVQMNGSDCGMFTCMFAETITRDDDISFGQEDMPFFRQKMVYELLTKHCFDDGPPPSCFRGRSFSSGHWTYKGG